MTIYSSILFSVFRNVICPFLLHMKKMLQAKKKQVTVTDCIVPIVIFVWPVFSTINYSTILV